jgi:hypothetical protein
MLPQKHLVVLSVLEGLVMFSAIIRVAIPGMGIDFSSQPQLIWFVATLFLSASSVAHYVVRASALGPRIKAGEQVEEDQKQILSISLALLGLAFLLSLAGPGAFQQLFG